MSKLRLASCAGTALASLALTASSAAAICPPPSTRAAERAAPLVFDAIALSDDNVHATADSPTRFRVVRRLRGLVPAVVRIATTQVESLDGVSAAVGGGLLPQPGRLHRIYAQPPASAGGAYPLEACANSRALARSALRRVRGGIATRLSGWTARTLKGPGGVRCARIERAGRVLDDDCVLRGRKSFAVAFTVIRDSRRRGVGTALAVTGANVRRVTVTSRPDGARAADAAVLQPALFAWNGVLQPRELRLEIGFAGGAKRTISLDGGLDAAAADTEQPFSWAARTQSADLGVCAGFRPEQPRYGALAVPARGASVCGDLHKTAFFFAIRPAKELRSGKDVRTGVFGAAGSTVRAVAVTGPDGARRELALSGRGRSFLSVYPVTVTAAQLSIDFTIDDGTVRRYDGRADAGVTSG